MFGFSLVPVMIAAERLALSLDVRTGPDRSFVTSVRAHGFELGMLVAMVHWEVPCVRDSQPVPPRTAGAMLRLDSWRVVAGLPEVGCCKNHPRLDQSHCRQRYYNTAL